MAVTAITKAVCSKFNAPTTVLTASQFTALNAVDGCSIAYDKPDHRILLMFKASTAGKVTIQKGSALQGVADLEVDVAADSTAFIVVESGAFVSAKGALKGSVLIKGPATISACAVALP